MNILVIAPHPDDEVLGPGGTLCSHAQSGDSVAAVFLTSGELGLKSLTPTEAKQAREAEARAAAKILGINACEFLRLADWHCLDAVEEGANLLVPLLRMFKPDIIYCPHEGEDHPDHQAALPILKLAANKLQREEEDAVITCYLYEVWTPLAWHDHLVDISESMDTKLNAMKCHSSQLEKFRFDLAIEGLNRYRGELFGGCNHAEVFQGIEM